MKGSAANQAYFDPGSDGDAAIGNFAQDAFGMILGYYDGDYSMTNGKGASYSTGGLSSTLYNGNSAYTGLYNGNISTWEWESQFVANSGMEHQALQKGFVYRYDELNRIRSAHFASNEGGTWDLYENHHTGKKVWETAYSYDRNGNLETLSRYDQTGVIKFDDLAYSYGANKRFTNRLDHVTDAGGSLAARGDIGGQSSSN